MSPQTTTLSHHNIALQENPFIEDMWDMLHTLQTQNSLISWFEQPSFRLLGFVESLRGPGPNLEGLAPVLELGLDVAEAHGGALDEGALGAHRVLQAGLGVCDVEVLGRQVALVNAGLGGALTQPRGEGGAPRVVREAFETVAVGGRPEIQITGKEKEIKETKLKLNPSPLNEFSYIFYF